MPASSPSLSGFIPHLPPVWADVFGEDDCGIFAECEVRGVRFIWRWISPGKFMMGCDQEKEPGFEWEKPRHEVILSRGFWLGETPVTQLQWQAVMDMNPSVFKGPLRPVENIDWDQSVAFATKVNELLPGLHAALPTEAQWEYACRAGTQSAYYDGSPWSQHSGQDSLHKLGWFQENSGGETHDVKRKEPNAWGLYDMHGNVWERCRDAMDETAYPRRGNITLDPEIVQNDKNASRIGRGGAWNSPSLYVRAAFRAGIHPSIRWNYVGIRLTAGQEPRAEDLP